MDFNDPDFLEKSSKEYLDLLEECNKQKGNNNFLYLCGECWVWVSSYQKKTHPSNHTIFTPAQYYGEEQLLILAKRFGKCKESNKRLLLKKIAKKTLRVLQKTKGTLRSNDYEQVQEQFAGNIIEVIS